MFGWRLVREREIELNCQLSDERLSTLRAEIVNLKEYIAKCERLIDAERERAIQERERADRLNDAILQQNGLPSVTATSLNDAAEAEERADKQRKKHEEFMTELAAESLGNMYDMSGLELPPVIAEMAKGIGIEVKSA